MTVMMSVVNNDEKLNSDSCDALLSQLTSLQEKYLSEWKGPAASCDWHPSAHV